MWAGEPYNGVMAPLILIVEDEPELARVVKDYMQKAGFRAEAVADGSSAISFYEHKRPDLVLLDLGLPKADGLDVARHIRRHSQTPIIIVTARVDETERVVGLELGADDYVTKPFSPRELVARVRAVLRRSQTAPEEPATIAAGDIEIDLIRHRTRIAGREVDLTPTEFGLLRTLARQPGRVFTRLQLLEAAQGETYEGYERTIDAHIKNLRAKIEPDARRPRYITTVYGVGYRLSDG